MTPEAIEAMVCQLKHRRPFEPFVIEMNDGRQLLVSRPGIAINGGGAVFFGVDDGLVDFVFQDVRTVRSLVNEALL